MDFNGQDHDMDVKFATGSIGVQLWMRGFRRHGPVSFLTGYVSTNGHKTWHQSEGIVPCWIYCAFFVVFLLRKSQCLRVFLFLLDHSQQWSLTANCSAKVFLHWFPDRAIHRQNNLTHLELKWILQDLAQLNLIQYGSYGSVLPRLFPITALVWAPFPF